MILLLPSRSQTPAAEGGADARLPGEGTGAGGSLPAEGISGHDTLSIATEESWEVQSHLSQSAQSVNTSGWNVIHEADYTG